MAISVSKFDVWSVEVADQPGAAAAKLGALAGAGVNLDFLLARRQADKPGTGIVFVSGIKGAKGSKAAAVAGLQKRTDLGGVRVDAPNQPGLCHRVLSTLATAGINVRGATASGSGSKCSMFVGFDSPADADSAIKALRKMGKK